MRGMIFAVSPEGVIGAHGQVPWHHPGDLRRFKRVTLGTTVIMGRATYDSVGKPLPGRRNVVVTSRPLDEPKVECVPTVAQALARVAGVGGVEGVEGVGGGDVWFIGGARIYEEAMRYVDQIDVTYVPDRIVDETAVYAPSIDESLFAPGPLLDHEDEPGLTRRVFTRR